MPTGTVTPPTGKDGAIICWAPILPMLAGVPSGLTKPVVVGTVAWGNPLGSVNVCGTLPCAVNSWVIGLWPEGLGAWGNPLGSVTAVLGKPGTCCSMPGFIGWKSAIGNCSTVEGCV